MNEYYIISEACFKVIMYEVVIDGALAHFHLYCSGHDVSIRTPCHPFVPSCNRVYLFEPWTFFSSSLLSHKLALCLHS